METEALISWSGVGLPGSRLTPRVALLHHTLHEPSPDLLEATDRAARSNACLIQVHRAGTGPSRRSRIAGSARGSSREHPLSKVVIRAASARAPLQAASTESTTFRHCNGTCRTELAAARVQPPLFRNAPDRPGPLPHAPQ